MKLDSKALLVRRDQMVKWARQDHPVMLATPEEMETLDRKVMQEITVQ